MDVDETIRQIISEYDENIILKDKQMEFFRTLINDKCDVLVNLPVGYGKSLCYHVLPQLLQPFSPTCENAPVVLVISPLNVIQKDQLSSLSNHNITACRIDVKGSVCLDAELPISLSKDCTIDDVKQGKFSIVMCHPEALFNTEDGRGLLNSHFPNHVVAVVIDECHIIDKWFVLFIY